MTNSFNSQGTKRFLKCIWTTIGNHESDIKPQKLSKLFKMYFSKDSYWKFIILSQFSGGERFHLKSLAYSEGAETIVCDNNKYLCINLLMKLSKNKQQKYLKPFDKHLQTMGMFHDTGVHL